MWLLDVNLPTALTRLLHGYDIVAETTAGRGWRELTNGALAQAASREGFRVLLTRDRRFGASAGSTLETLPELAIVIVTLSQVREAAYLSAFDAAWRRRPIEPVADPYLQEAPGGQPRRPHPLRLGQGAGLARGSATSPPRGPEPLSRACFPAGPCRPRARSEPAGSARTARRCPD